MVYIFSILTYLTADLQTRISPRYTVVNNRLELTLIWYWLIVKSSVQTLYVVTYSVHKIFGVDSERACPSLCIHSALVSSLHLLVKLHGIDVCRLYL